MFQKNNKLKDALKNPFILGMVLVVMVIFIILIIVSIIKMNNKAAPELTFPSEYDPASEETIYFYPNTSGEPMPKIIWVGLFDNLTNNGVTVPQYQIFQSAIEKYADSINYDLFRVSYLKDSYSLKDSYVFDFKVVLNIDKKTLGVEINSSTGWQNIMGMFVKITDEDGKEVYRLTIDKSNICDYQKRCELVDDGT